VGNGAYFMSDDPRAAGEELASLRRQLEESRRNEERTRLMVESVKDYAIFMLDPSGNILSWNAGAERTKGYTASEIIGKHFSIFYPEETKHQHPREELEQAVRDGRYEEEGIRLRKNGERFWAHVVITAIFDREGRHLGFTKVTRDITERRAAEHALRLSEQRFSVLVESVRDYAIFMLDPTGVVLSWNTGAQRIKQYSAGEIIGKHFSVFYEEKDRLRGHPAEVLQAALDNGAYGEEGWRVRKDGTRFWAGVVLTTLRDTSGRHIGFAKVTRDLTERREYEENLRQSEERLRLMIESVKDYAIYMLDVTGNVATWNSGATKIKGYTASEIIGRHFSIFYPPEDIAAGRPARELRIAAAEGRYEEENHRVRKNGEKFWANTVLTALYDPVTQELRGFVKVTRDLTERRKYEQEARKAAEQAGGDQARAFEAEKALRHRDEFISVAAHELRTPLTALTLKIQGVKLGMQHQPQAAPAKTVERLDGALRQVARLSELVERLLDVSKLVRGKLAMNLEPLDLAAIARHVVDDFSEQAHETGTKLTLDAPQSLEGQWDRSRLEQVLVNLLGNALKYAPGKPIEVKVSGTADRVHLVVADQGIGIAQQDLGRIFERFERAVPVRKYGGMGLGLYLTKNIIDAHGGTIRVESSPGKGATFEVDLPRRTTVQAHDPRVNA
jgi:PAS domain S-box-containing protein